MKAGAGTATPERAQSYLSARLAGPQLTDDAVLYLVIFLDLSSASRF